MRRFRLVPYDIIAKDVAFHAPSALPFPASPRFILFLGIEAYPSVILPEDFIFGLIYLLGWAFEPLAMTF